MTRVPVDRHDGAYSEDDGDVRAVADRSKGDVKNSATSG